MVNVVKKQSIFFTISFILVQILITKDVKDIYMM